jgi:excinuclease UvrABC nuclease subunit
MTLNQYLQDLREDMQNAASMGDLVKAAEIEEQAQYLAFAHYKYKHHMQFVNNDIQGLAVMPHDRG